VTLYDEKPNQVDAERFSGDNQSRIAGMLSHAGYKDIKMQLSAFGEVRSMAATTDDGLAIEIEVGQWLVWSARNEPLVAMDPADFRRKYRATPEDTAALSMIREVNQQNTTKGITS
jgi:hypothetical protein